MDSIRSIDRLWSVEDVSEYLGVPVKTLYQWKWRGEGPPVRRSAVTSDTTRHP
jgi:hypothetical protein